MYAALVRRVLLALRQLPQWYGAVRATHAAGSCNQLVADMVRLHLLSWPLGWNTNQIVLETPFVILVLVNCYHVRERSGEPSTV